MNLDTIVKGRRIVVWRKFQLKQGKRKPLRTICEVLRELYRTADERGDALAMTQLEEAHDMAKRMQTKLVEYAANHGHAVYLIADDHEGMLWTTKDDFKGREAAKSQAIQDQRAAKVAKKAQANERSTSRPTLRKPK